MVIAPIDDLEIAQFIYLLLNNNKIRRVIDSISSKVALILGRFSPERKHILDRIRDELRKRNYSPVLFDFDKPANRDMTETIATLAHISRFVVADLTDARSVREELLRIVPSLPSVPVLPLLHESDKPYPMFEHVSRQPSMLKIVQYRNTKHLVSVFGSRIVDPCKSLAQQLAGRLREIRREVFRPRRTNRRV